MTVTAALAAVTLAACATASPIAPTDPPSSSTLGAPSTSTSATTTSTSLAPTTSSTNSTTTEPTTVTIPPSGQPIDGPPRGSIWSVVGVAHDDVLNLRSGPGVSHPVAATLAPITPNVIATGVARSQEASVWWGVQVESIDGWVNAAYLAVEGTTEDATSSIVSQLGSVPAGDTIADLGAIVIDARAPSSAVTVVVDAPVPGDELIGEMTIDVFVPHDDSVRGERLHVFGQRLGTSSDWSLYAVESTSLCWRDADAMGLCV